ncbi:MAG TPA: hypothetical protein VH518_12915 [Tepidisphaeraceae bacterium]
MNAPREFAGKWHWLAAVLGVLVCAGAGCESGYGARSVKNPDPAAKIPATVDAAARKDMAAIPQLVADLENDDPAVRFYAIGALERVTGHTFGYQYFVDEDKRASAVQQWKAWLEGWRAGQKQLLNPESLRGANGGGGQTSNK